MTIETVPAFLQGGLTEEERFLIKQMTDRLAVYEVSNSLKEKYYEGTMRVQNLGIAIPPHLSNLHTVVGWAGTTVDVLAERLEWQGWQTFGGNDYGLGDIYLQNSLEVDAGLGTTDALIYGTSFVVVGYGDTGEPNPLITVESARNMTGNYDPRTRRLSSALGINGHNKAGQVDDVTLYMPYGDLRVTKNNGVWAVQSRSNHGFGRVLVAQMFNDPRASMQGGRSEITHAIRSYVDQGVRTMLGMEINREFYSSPQRYMLGADADAFTDDDGNPLPGWEAVMSNMFVAPMNDQGKNPEVGQFTAASPAPYTEQLRVLSQMVAAEAAMPSSYLGFESDNPTSADAIRQAEARLIKRAERRQMMFGRAWDEAGRLALLVRDGEIPDDYASQVNSRWRDAATPTRSAAADEVVKLVQAEVLPADSEVVLDRIGLDPTEKRQVLSDRRRANASQRVADLRAAVTTTEAGTEEEVA